MRDLYGTDKRVNMGLQDIISNLRRGNSFGIRDRILLRKAQLMLK